MFSPLPTYDVDGDNVLTQGLPRLPKGRYHRAKIYSKALYCEYLYPRSKYLYPRSMHTSLSGGLPEDEAY